MITNDEDDLYTYAVGQERELHTLVEIVVRSVHHSSRGASGLRLIGWALFLQLGLRLSLGGLLQDALLDGVGTAWQLCSCVLWELCHLFVKR